MRIILFLGLCFLPFGYGADSVQVEPAALPVRKYDVVCNRNEEVCDTRCYNPTTHKCLLPTKGGLHKLCPIDQTLCGNQCWSSSSSGGKICTPETDGALGNVCEPGELSCGWNCYKPEEKECFDQNWLCTKGQLLCGNECYSPDDSVKCLPSKRGTSLCKSDEVVCGGWGCYNPKEKTCFEKEDEICPKGHQLCGRACYNPSAGDTCHNGTYGGVACKAHEKFCNHRCYDPKEGKICANDALVCNTGEIDCGYECYKPSSGATCFDARPDYQVLCEKGKNYCHYHCYDPKTEACMTVEGDSLKIVCPIGQKVCNGKLGDFSWGAGCYDPVTSDCLKDKDNSYVLCKKEESLCGTTCYTPVNDGLVCRKNRALCTRDDKLCGDLCYDSETQKCFRDVVSDLQ